MLPRGHFLVGLIVGIILYLFLDISYIETLLFILSSVLIDFDHYMVAAIRQKSLSLHKAFKYHDKMLKKEAEENAKGIRVKGDFHIFHTLEFHIFVFILSLYLTPFTYVFWGMVLHSITDIIWLVRFDRLYRREFFFTRWLISSRKLSTL